MAMTVGLMADQTESALDMLLPCDVRIGSVLFHKGVRLGTLASAASRWHAQAAAASPSPPPEQVAEFHALRAEIDLAGEPDPHLAALVEAVWQVLDDMDQSGTCCCLAAKAQLRVAFEPYRDPELDLAMPLATAADIMQRVAHDR